MRRSLTALAVIAAVAPAVLPAQQQESKEQQTLRAVVRQVDGAGVRRLVERRIEFDGRDVQGQTVLFQAARNGFTEIARLLRRAGARN